MLGKAAEVELSQIPFSNDTISDRIEDMSKDILAQVVADLISSPAKFSLQLDETTDVSNLSQLAVFVRYVKALNHLNQQMQGGGVNIIEAEENLKAFQKHATVMETTNRER
ncbi:protein ZBED8-like isoform X1 [Tachysurus ichikawai]